MNEKKAEIKDGALKKEKKERFEDKLDDRNPKFNTERFGTSTVGSSTAVASTSPLRKKVAEKNKETE